MATVTEIESAIVALSTKEFAELRDWFATYDEQQWDKQIERDSQQENKLKVLADKALADYRAGNFREF